MSTQLFAVVGIVVVLVVLIVVVAYWAQQKRVKGLRAFAASQGYEFVGKDPGLAGQLGGFAFFSQHSLNDRHITSVLRGEADGASVSIFDFTYTTGTARNPKTVAQTVLLFEAKGLDLPAFALRPEGLGQKLQIRLGQQDIDLVEHRDFSKAYVLQGADEARIRALFRGEKPAFFAGRPGRIVEGNGQRLLYFRAGKLVVPKALPSFVEEGQAALRVLAGS